MENRAYKTVGVDPTARSLAATAQAAANAAQATANAASGGGAVFARVDISGGISGTITNAAIHVGSTVLFTLELSPSEDIFPRIWMSGPPREGAVDWVLSEGHDNACFLHYTIFN